MEGRCLKLEAGVSVHLTLLNGCDHGTFWQYIIEEGNYQAKQGAS